MSWALLKETGSVDGWLWALQLHFWTENRFAKESWLWQESYRLTTNPTENTLPGESEWKYKHCKNNVDQHCQWRSMLVYLSIFVDAFSGDHSSWFKCWFYIDEGRKSVWGGETDCKLSKFFSVLPMSTPTHITQNNPSRVYFSNLLNRENLTVNG